MAKLRARSTAAALLAALFAFLLLVPPAARVHAAAPPLPASRLEFGLANGPANLSWMTASGVPWKYRYQYLAGGVNTPNPWQTWQDLSLPPGQFAVDYMSNSQANGYIPVFTYYEVLQSSPSVGADEATRDYNNLNNTATMNSYYADFKVLMQKAGAFGQKVVVHVEPDLWGYLQMRAGSGDASTVSASVNSSGFADVTGIGLPNTVQGFAWALLHMRDLYAPNVVMAIHASPWSASFDIATNTDPSLPVVTLADRSAAFLNSAGISANTHSSTWDVVFNDLDDHDAGWWEQQGVNHWWDPTNTTFPNFTRYLAWVAELQAKTGRQQVAWQVPNGNQYFLTMNNTCGHYQDNVAQYFIAHPSELTAAGLVAVMFGAGNACQTAYTDARNDGVTNGSGAPINDAWGWCTACNTHTSTYADDDGGYLRIFVGQYYNSIGAPTNVVAAAGDGTASVTWTAPTSTAPITSYVVTAYDGCTIQGSQTVSGAPPATTLAFGGLTNGTRYTFKVAAVTSNGTGPQSPASNVVTPSGTAPTWVTTCSTQQYSLTGSNGATWQDVDASKLNVTFTPGAGGWAVLSGNADLWTANAGYNQNLGISVSGGLYPSVASQPEAWKESGGFAGTFSPNAATVQTVIPVVSGVTYTAKLQWKASSSDPGTIYAGAGPINGAYSPTRLTVQLISVANTVFSRVLTGQPGLSGGNGTTWQDVDAANLSLSFTPPAGTWAALVSGNADLWTSTAGYNQDIGVTLSGGAYPTVAGQPEAWKESGGLAGTFSPNAALVQTALPVTAGVSYTARLQWKANKGGAGSIHAGAGPIGGAFSPTTLVVILVPAPVVGASAAQNNVVNSNGVTWQAMDLAALKLTLAPSANTSYQISANADLWTAVAGYNQGIGIMVSGGPYGAGTLVAWKESGGFAGTFSPNAAFVFTDLHLQGGNTYTAWIVWKANHAPIGSSAIYAGAGPVNAKFSATSLAAIALSQP